ncbi:MAG: hypothetical protein JWP97_6694, partial [Labilithrix sp.]|nr:hypothetical protein [Labilithrix sp.]
GPTPPPEHPAGGEEPGGHAHPGDRERAALDEETRAPATDVRLAPSPRGVFGAWLVAGPFRAGRPALEAAPAGVDERALVARSAAVASGERDFGGPKKKPPARWTIASSSDGPIDLKAVADTPGTDLVAYAAATLHLTKDAHVLVLLAVDDGVRLSVDGRVVLTRDEARPVRDDDDVVPLDLAAGDHALLLKLHQREGAWGFRVRITDGSLAPLVGSYLQLPGTNADDARALAGRMSSVSIDRAFDGAAQPARYLPRLTVRYGEGAPRGVPLPVTARLVRGDASPAFDVAAGGVPVAAAGVSELVVALPEVLPSRDAGTIEAVVAGRSVKAALPARPLAEQAVAHAERALAKVPDGAPFLAAGSRDSVVHLTRRLTTLLSRGDGDGEAQNDEARELDGLAAALDRGADPYQGRTGAMRRAFRDPLDGDTSEIGVYVPPGFREGGTRRYPLVVGLHGLNGTAMGVLRWMFGGDDPKQPQGWEDRHTGPLPPFDGFVLTPSAHGNSLYRELGEVDVMNALRWAMSRYPIDPSRVTITGPSMGGIGSAAIPLHRPHVFAAAEPLCGYHSYFVRSDVAGRSLRPWERYLAEERSNVMWAENGEHLPLWIVHGTKDLPEANSGVLIDRYEELHFSVKHDHPDAGHNVWQETYEDLKGLGWLAARRLDLHPQHVRFKTSRTRWSTSAWVIIDELGGPAAWGEVDARVSPKTHTVNARTSGVAQLTLSREEPLIGEGPVAVSIDGRTLAFDAGERIVLSRQGATWVKGTRAHGGAFKHGAVTGPLRDVFSEPILFVYGSEGDEARANEQVARHFAKIRAGVTVAYPVISDADFFARNEPLANDRALFLVGRRNLVRAALERSAPFPVQIADGVVGVGTQRITGAELGAAFIRPNPARPDRYVVVVAGADVPGTLRAMSLPDLLPDFVVWDAAVAPARGAILLGAGAFRAAGFFDQEWALPTTIDDPLARSRPARAPAAAPDAEPKPGASDG